MRHHSFARRDRARYELLPERSRVWTRSRSSFVPISGRATAVTGFVELTLDGAGRIDLAVPPAARIEVPVDRLTCGNPLYDWQVPHILDAARHPVIVAELTTAWPAIGRDRFRITGNLTIAGAAAPVECELTLYRDDDIGLEADWQFVLDIRRFPFDLPPLMRMKTHPEIDVRVHIEALRVDSSTEPGAIAV